MGRSYQQKGRLTVALEDTRTPLGTDAAAAPVGCPAHVPPDQFRHFDYIDDIESAPTPFDGYLQFRGERPFWSDVAGGFWVLTNAATVRDCFQQPENFSNCNIGLGYTEQSRRMIPEQLDPPEHGKYRKLLSPFFTPSSARRLQEGIRAVCEAELDKFVHRGHCEFVEEFAGRFPQIVFIQYIMNFPVEEMETFLGWEHDIMRHPVEESAARASAQELWSYLADTIEKRTRDPLEGDMLSALAQTEVDGRPITQDELLDIAWLLFAAGLDTVTQALAFSFYYLARSPEHRDQIVANPEIIPMAVEELLRYCSFVNPVRTATRDIEFHGANIKAGDRIVPSATLASRDPAEFDQPDDIIFDRPIKRHMAFGAGVHRCLGAHLARLELQTAFEEIHRRMPDYELQPGVKVRFHGAGVLGADNLPLRWTSADS
jgi:cytochrome P450